jgi:hypothetical protein
MPRQGRKENSPKTPPPGSGLDIDDNNSIDGLLHRMAHNQEDAEKQAQSVRLLLDAFLQSPVQSGVDVKRAANAIIVSMKAHSTHVDLQTSACLILLCICKQDTKILEYL